MAAKGSVGGLASSLAGLADIVRGQRRASLYLLNFLVFLAMFGYFRSVLIYIVDRWQTPVDTATLIYAGLSLISGLASFGAMGPLSRTFGLRKLAIWSSLIGGIAMIAIVIPPELPTIWATAGVATFAGTLTLASAPALLANATEPDLQGRVLGNNQAIQVGSEAISAALGGALTGLFLPLPLALFGLVLIAVGLLLMVESTRKVSA